MKEEGRRKKEEGRRNMRLSAFICVHLRLQRRKKANAIIRKSFSS
jgi:hypothetical protein